MRSTMLSIILLFLCNGLLTTTDALNYNVHLFYYPWYGNPNVSKEWVHWNSNAGSGHTPPNDITSNYYPVLGAYDSCDPKVLEQHMQWISDSGAGTIISSWWGKGGFEDHCVTAILDAANKKQIKVGFHIEPYGNRTAASVVNDVAYINEKYGSHAAYFHDSASKNRDVFYIFDSLAIADWSPVESLKDKHILLHQTTDQSKQHFSGFYNYAIGDDANIVGIWKSMHDFCKDKGLIWSPSIGPGYVDRRAVPDSKAHIVDRKDGKDYDANWGYVFESGIPHYVSITSFNEWHEGSMLEPASSSPPSGFNYSTYSGAYGKTGKASETAYIERTKYFVDEFTKKSQA